MPLNWHDDDDLDIFSVAPPETLHCTTVACFYLSIIIIIIISFTGLSTVEVKVYMFLLMIWNLAMWQSSFIYVYI